MKIFISQPMRGKTAEEIITERERLIGKAREHYGALAAEMVRESMTMTANWLGITAASKVALEMTEE